MPIMRSSCFSSSSSFSSLASMLGTSIRLSLLPAMPARAAVASGYRRLSLCSSPASLTLAGEVRTISALLRAGTAQPAPSRFGYADIALPAKPRRFSSVGASQVSGPGSIDSPMIQAMEKKIKEQLDADFVTVKDLDGDGRHVSISVVSKAFDGQSAVNRQRMVYKVIWEELQTTVHAVDQMTTKTPAEASSDK